MDWFLWFVFLFLYVNNESFFVDKIEGNLLLNKVYISQFILVYISGDCVSLLVVNVIILIDLILINVFGNCLIKVNKIVSWIFFYYVWKIFCVVVFYKLKL